MGEINGISIYLYLREAVISSKTTTFVEGSLQWMNMSSDEKASSYTNELNSYYTPELLVGLGATDFPGSLRRVLTCGIIKTEIVSFQTTKRMTHLLTL